MDNKKNFKNILWPIRTRHLIACAIFFAVLGVFGLRNNNLRMIAIREEVYVADKAGADVGARLDELRRYVFAHMNSSTSVELKYTYEKAAQESIKQSNNVSSNVNIFQNLPTECGGGATFADSTDPCVSDFINKQIEKIGGKNPQPIKLPNKQLYIHTYKSPLFSFDFAGVCLLIALLSAISSAGFTLLRFVQKELAFYKGDIDGL